MVLFTQKTRIILTCIIIGLLLLAVYLYIYISRNPSNGIPASADIENIDFVHYEHHEGVFHSPNSSRNYSFATVPGELDLICHTKNTLQRSIRSKSILLYGATSFLGSKVAISLHQSGYQIKLIEDLDNIALEPIAWYRWQELQKLKLDSEYVQMDSINHIFSNHHIDTIVFVPTPLFDGFSNSDQLFKLKMVAKVLKNFVDILEKAKSDELKVILLSVSKSTLNSIQKSWLRALELSLSAYQSFGVQAGLIRMDGVYGPWEGKGDDIYPNLEKSCLYVGKVQNVLLNTLKSKESCIVADLSEQCNKPSESMDTTIQWADEYTKLLDKRKDVVISTYFTKPKNPMYSYQIRSRSGLFMKQWFLSVVKLGLNLVIFHDNFDQPFMDRIKSVHPNTEFVKVNDLHGRTTNDYRFYLTYKYLLQHPEIRRAVLTDMRDVKFFGNPFSQMEVIGDWLYIGIDVSFYLAAFDHSWLRGVLRSCHRKDATIDEVRLHPFLNAGVTGGSRHFLLAFLTQMTRYFDKSPHYQNCNMGTITVVGHKHFHDYLYNGYPIQSAFKLGMVGSVPQGQSIKHKDTEKYYY